MVVVGIIMKQPDETSFGIKYVIGDATRPEGPGPKVIVHVCNDVGAWGAGFVMALSARWPEPEARYRKWHNDGRGFALGAVQYVYVEPSTLVANMIGQHGVGGREPPVRYDAIRKGLHYIGDTIGDDTVHMPRIGCGLAGGSGEHIEAIIQETLIAKGVSVTVYDLLR